MKDNDISALIANNLEKAKNTIIQAEALYNIKQYIGVVNRGYYAMFYSASAILLTKGLGTSKHYGVMSLIDREFVNKKEIDSKWSKSLRNAFNLRSWGDYDEKADITEKQAEELLNDAKSFVSWAERWLKERGWIERD